MACSNRRPPGVARLPAVADQPDVRLVHLVRSEHREVEVVRLVGALRPALRDQRLQTLQLGVIGHGAADHAQQFRQVLARARGHRDQRGKVPFLPQPVEERQARGEWAASLSFPALHRLWQLMLKGHDEVAKAVLPIEAAIHAPSEQPTTLMSSSPSASMRSR